MKIYLIERLDGERPQEAVFLAESESEVREAFRGLCNGWNHYCSPDASLRVSEVGVYTGTLNASNYRWESLNGSVALAVTDYAPDFR